MSIKPKHHNNDIPPPDDIREDVDDMKWEAEDEEVMAAGKGDKLKQLREELKEMQRERDEYLAGWQRSKADYINLRNEEEKKRGELREVVREDVLYDLLPTLDSFEMAMKNREVWESVDKNWRIGVEYIYQQIMTVLQKYNVTEINETGIEFDPNIHEVSEIAEDGGMTVSSIVQKGYRMGNKIIRPAKVILKK